MFIKSACNEHATYVCVSLCGSYICEYNIKYANIKCGIGVERNFEYSYTKKIIPDQHHNNTYEHVIYGCLSLCGSNICEYNII